MNAHDLLHELRWRDISVEVDGPNLVLEGPTDELNDALLERLRAAKSDLLTTLSAEASTLGWDRDDWRAYFEERSAIREYDGGISSIAAQLLAYGDTVQHWLRLNPPSVDAWQICVHCGQPEGPAGALLSLLSGGRHVSVHERCWEPWSRYQEARAEEALRRCGIDLTNGQSTS